MAGGPGVMSLEVVQVKFETTKGDFVVEVHPEWAPLGAERFLDLVRDGFYDGCRFFRVVPGFVVQWGINGDPEVQAKWREARIPDDPVKQSNTRGMLTFAKNGADSRTSQLFVNFKDNSNLDGMGFAAFARVIAGMEVLEKLNSQYGDEPTPRQGMIQEQGNAFLDSAFPGLDSIVKATILESNSAEGSAVDDEPKAPAGEAN